MIGELAIAVAIVFSATLIARSLKRIEGRVTDIDNKMVHVEGNTMLSAQHLESISAASDHIEPIRTRAEAMFDRTS